jgi:acetyl esterase/lipase
MVNIVISGVALPEKSLNMNPPITYTHPLSASFMSQFLQFAMSILGMKKAIEKKMKTNDFSHVAAGIPKSLQRNFEVSITKENDRKIWTFKPKQAASEKRILYIHGGAYISNISKYHWQLIEQLLFATNATIIVPDYPLAPTATCTDVLEMVEKVYDRMLETNDASNLIFMGDSAGAGLAFALAQKLRNDQKTQPNQLILLSPWLDITMENPDIQQVDKKDKMLSIKGLQMAGQAYTGNLDTKDYRVSPIYGNFNDLGKISVFIGTHDLFIEDSRKLKAMLEGQGIHFNFFEYPKMFHVWMVITSLEEAKAAIIQISDLVNGEN